ncbi:MAG: MerC domain-containing protein [Planctomycetota bacterium]
MDTTSVLDRQTGGDLAGMVASIACAIHCAAMPLVIGYLPMLGLSWLADPAFHRVMAFVCFGLALSAFVPGWRRHRSLAPTLFGSIGVGLLSVAAFGLEGECCPTCATAAEPTPPEAAACSDDGCVHCSHEVEAAVVESTLPAPSSSLAWLIPLITPVGGVFLVAGHVSNHRLSAGCCDCDCCSDAAKQAETA